MKLAVVCRHSARARAGLNERVWWRPVDGGITGAVWALWRLPSERNVWRLRSVHGHC